MMDFELFLNDFSAKVEKRKVFAESELARLPQGRLREELHGGKPYYSIEFYEEGVRRRKGISKDRTLLTLLVRRALYEKELEALAAQQRAIELCKDTLRPYDYDSVIQSLKMDCPNLPADVIDEALKTVSPAATLSEWEAKPYEQSDYKPEARKHITSRGLRVRSKSELCIAEKLYEHGIAFHYEQVIRKNDITIIPDFTIKRADGKLFIWEHEGMTNVEDYIRWQKRKGEVYASMNIVPWDNLIVTYDNEFGDIDLRIVESEIRNKLEIML